MLRFLAAAILVSATVLLGAHSAHAEGTVRIQRADGSSNVYPNSRITIVDNKLKVTSADGKGTLIIQRAACSHQGAILVCLPTEVTQIQDGVKKPFPLNSGTVYANLTSDPQPLAYSSRRMPPNSIMLSLVTARGTYLSIEGGIDAGAVTK